MDRSGQRIGSALFIFAAGIIISSLAYRGSFNYFNDPVSELGALVTADGLSNTASHIIYASGCSLAAASFLLAWRDSRRTSLILMAIGLVLMPIPYDRYLSLHQFASGIAVGGAWLYCTSHLYHNRKGIRSQLLFQTPVLVYAFFHITSSPFKEELQTFAVASLLLTMADSIHTFHLQRHAKA